MDCYYESLHGHYYSGTIYHCCGKKLHGGSLHGEYSSRWGPLWLLLRREPSTFVMARALCTGCGESLHRPATA